MSSPPGPCSTGRCTPDAERSHKYTRETSTHGLRFCCATRVMTRGWLPKGLPGACGASIVGLIVIQRPQVARSAARRGGSRRCGRLRARLRPTLVHSAPSLVKLGPNPRGITPSSVEVCRSSVGIAPAKNDRSREPRRDEGPEPPRINPGAVLPDSPTSDPTQVHLGPESTDIGTMPGCLGPTCVETAAEPALLPRPPKDPILADILLRQSAKHPVTAASSAALLAGCADILLRQSAKHRVTAASSGALLAGCVWGPTPFADNICKKSGPKALFRCLLESVRCSVLSAGVHRLLGCPGGQAQGAANAAPTALTLPVA